MRQARWTRMVTVLCCVLVFLAMALEAAAAPSARVKCEKRTSPARSKISVDGNDLAPGDYKARVTSPAGSLTNTVTSATGTVVAAPVAADAFEFDFDSNFAVVVPPVAGATPIGATFIAGNVKGEVLTAGGATVASQVVDCLIK